LDIVASGQKRLLVRIILEGLVIINAHFRDITSARNVTIKSGASSVAEAPTKIPTQTSSGGPSDTNSADQDSTTWKVVVGVVVPVVCALIAAWATIWNRNRNK